MTSNSEIAERYDGARDIAAQAGRRAEDYFCRYRDLRIESKGPQDLVSEADRDVELFIRREVASRFPGDGVIGEEFCASKSSNSDFLWVIDPIDGTANFVHGIPMWCVVIAIVHRNQTVVGVVNDAVHSEQFHARRNCGASLNDKVIKCAISGDFTCGLVGLDTSSSHVTNVVPTMITRLMAQGGKFACIGSAALGLSYVADGRFIGYAQRHLNAWDCLASLLIIDEAGGCTIDLNLARMLSRGGPVLAAAPGIAKVLCDLSNRVFNPATGPMTMSRQTA